MIALVEQLLESALAVAIRLIGESEARRITTERLEIVAARVAADAEAAAKFGQVPPP